MCARMWIRCGPVVQRPDFYSQKKRLTGHIHVERPSKYSDHIPAHESVDATGIRGPVFAPLFGTGWNRTLRECRPARPGGACADGIGRDGGRQVLVIGFRSGFRGLGRRWRRGGLIQVRRTSLVPVGLPWWSRAGAGDCDRRRVSTGAGRNGERKAGLFTTGRGSGVSAPGP